jgi:hypothetical protein
MRLKEGKALGNRHCEQSKALRGNPENKIQKICQKYCIYKLDCHTSSKALVRNDG